MKQSLCRHRFQIWLAGLAAAIALLLFWPNVVHALEVESTWGSASLTNQAKVSDAPAQDRRVFLPVVYFNRTPSTFTLIDQALAAGEIDAETALTYQVFATFGDGRLPARFWGDNSRVIDSDAVFEATQRYATLSAPTRAILLPFLIPPVYRGSWYDLRARGAAGVAAAPADEDSVPNDDPEPIEDSCEDLATDLLVPLESDHFVVWYPPGDLGYWLWAQQTSQDLETRVYPTLTNIMGKTPKSDAGQACNPSDGRFDVYIAPDRVAENPRALAYVAPYPEAGCKDAPAYMVLLRHGPSDIGVLVHELMHMIQRAYNVRAPCLGGYYTGWWSEATANWAVDAFEVADPAPDNNTEHSYAVDFLATAMFNLWSREDDRAYGAYLFPFYLARQFPPAPGERQIIPRIFAALEQEGGENLYSVINASIPGGLAQRWAEFNLYNLNLSPNNPYQTWDGFSTRWGDYRLWRRWRANLDLQGQPQRTRAVGYNNAISPFLIVYLAASHLSVGLSQDVRLFAFGNTYVGIEGVNVQALARQSDQSWQGPLDWTQQRWNILCLDQATSRPEELLVLLSNSDWPEDLEQDPGTLPEVYSNGPLQVVGSNLGCWRWQGASYWQIAGRSWTAETEVTYTIRGEATPTFTLTRQSVTGDRLLLELQPVSGNATWITALEARNLQTGQVVRCDRSGQQALTPAMGGLWINESLGREQLERRFFGGGQITAGNQCPGLEPWATVPWLQTDLRNSDLRPWPSSNGSRLQGNDSLTVSGDGYEYTITSGWNFTALSSAP